jgi:outer membrane protein assembly factor BamD (BamD/ComL family)
MARRRQKFTAEQYKALKQVAATVTGYDNTSIIWNMTEDSVLQQISDLLNAGSYNSAVDHIDALLQRHAYNRMKVGR